MGAGSEQPIILRHILSYAGCLCPAWEIGELPPLLPAFMPHFGKFRQLFLRIFEIWIPVWKSRLSPRYFLAKMVCLDVA